MVHAKPGGFLWQVRGLGLHAPKFTLTDASFNKVRSGAAVRNIIWPGLRIIQKECARPSSPRQRKAVGRQALPSPSSLVASPQSYHYYGAGRAPDIRALPSYGATDSTRRWREADTESKACINNPSKVRASVPQLAIQSLQYMSKRID